MVIALGGDRCVHHGKTLGFLTCMNGKFHTCEGWIV